MNNAYGTVPATQLRTDRDLLKTILLSIVTFGIYPLVLMTSIVNDLNLVASKYDGKKTMHYCLLIFILSPITCSIMTFVWYHNFSNRVGDELRRRGIAYNFGASDYWLWSILGSMIVVGPYVYLYKLFEAVNKINADYNVNG